MHVSGTIPITNGMTVGELRNQLHRDGVPDRATVRVHVTPGDVRDPGVQELQVSWDTSPRPVPPRPVMRRGPGIGEPTKLSLPRSPPRPARSSTTSLTPTERRTVGAMTTTQPEPEPEGTWQDAEADDLDHASATEADDLDHASATEAAPEEDK